MAALPLPLSIRAYRLSDWPRLCDIYDRARLDELRRSAGVDSYRPLARTAHSEGLFDSELDVAEVDGVVRGFVAFRRDSLNWLYVDPDCYRLGVGRALLRHALALSGPSVSTQALEGNEPAIALYRSEGFVEIERRRGRLAGGDGFLAVGVVLRLLR